LVYRIRRRTHLRCLQPFSNFYPVFSCMHSEALRYHLSQTLRRISESRNISSFLFTCVVSSTFEGRDGTAFFARLDQSRFSHLVDRRHCWYRGTCSYCVWHSSLTVFRIYFHVFTPIIVSLRCRFDTQCHNGVQEQAG
jgi:hypothetical protein